MDNPEHKHLKTISGNTGYISNELTKMNETLNRGLGQITGKLEQIADTRSTSQHRIAALQRQSEAVENLDHLIQDMIDFKRRFSDYKKIHHEITILEIRAGQIKDILLGIK